jgi:ketosteroid isomerase-like protein
VEAAVALTDPDAELWPEGTAAGLGREEPYRGHDGMREYFADVERAWRSLEVHPGELRSVATAVIAFGTAYGVRHDGTIVELPVIWTFKLRDGLLLSGRIVATAAQAHASLHE